MAEVNCKKIVFSSSATGKLFNESKWNFKSLVESSEKSMNRQNAWVGYHWQKNHQPVGQLILMPDRSFMLKKCYKIFVLQMTPYQLRFQKNFVKISKNFSETDQSCKLTILQPSWRTPQWTNWWRSFWDAEQFDALYFWVIKILTFCWVFATLLQPSFQITSRHRPSETS